MWRRGQKPRCSRPGEVLRDIFLRRASSLSSSNRSTSEVATLSDPTRKWKKQKQKTKKEVSHHSVALSCLQTVQRYVIINRWQRRQFATLLVQCCRKRESRHPKRWEKAIEEEQTANGLSLIFLTSVEQVHPRGDITIKVLKFLSLKFNTKYFIYMEYKTKTKKWIY